MPAGNAAGEVGSDGCCDAEAGHEVTIASSGIPGGKSDRNPVESEKAQLDGREIIQDTDEEQQESGEQEYGGTAATVEKGGHAPERGGELFLWLRSRCPHSAQRKCMTGASGGKVDPRSSIDSLLEQVCRNDKR